MKLTLIRHTSLAIPEGVCYGQSDVDVAASFMRESQHVQNALAETPFDVLYTSPLQRCVKLAERLNVDPLFLDDRLQELSFGDWEMLAWNDIPREVFDNWAHNYAHIAPPGGETFRQMQMRVLGFLEEARSQHSGQHVAVVTHGGVIRALIAHVLDMPLKGLFRFKIDHGSLTQLEFADAIPRIHYINR